ncbi:BLUF domain-containing protein [Paracoccus tegillarcae]|uniref:BLUF domain-containing protein n=1 Tax=Paracoccus tegillarcae TaxID=1529068 RepID=UPI0013006F92|nr:BLUF domain-containing protein [Paracoccus tegillarcae]
MISDTGAEIELTHFLYRSTARGDLGQDEVNLIIAKASRRNHAIGLTGCLHYEDGLFFQWLEGPRTALDKMIQLILADPRHSDIAKLSYGSSAQRHFPEWAMRPTSRAQGSLMDWVATTDVSTVNRGAYAGAVSAFLVAITH